MKIFKLSHSINFKIFVMLCISCSCFAAKKHLLTLNDAIMLSLRFSPGVKSTEVQRVVDKFNLAVAKNQFEFQYALAGSALQTNSVINGGPLNSSGAYNLIPAISRLTPYGTRYTLTMNNNVTLNKTVGFPETGHYNPALNFQVTQPILQGSGREVVESALVQAFNNAKVAEQTFKNNMMSKVTQITQDYRNLVAANNALKVAIDALQAAKKNVRENEERIKLGFMAPAENTQAKSFVATQELQVTSTEFAVLQSKLILLQDIGLSPDTPIIVDNTIKVTRINYPKGESAKRLLFTNNPTYLNALDSLRNAKISLLQAEDQQRWSLNFVGNVTQGNGSGGDGNSGIASLYNGRNRARSLGLQLNVPIDNLPLQQQLVNAKVAYTQQELAVKDLRLSLQTTLLTSLENLKILYLQVKIAQDAEKLSYQAYLDALNKVRFGQASMFEVTTLQSTYINNRLITINTEISYLNGITQYQQLLGITLDQWKIQLVY